MATIRRDPCGVPYDRSWTDTFGTTHYALSYEAGGLPGGAEWSSEHDCNPICGCHLSSKCRGCSVCTYCDGCYCNEGEY